MQAILSPSARGFLAALHRRFNPRRLELLERRRLTQQALDQGKRPVFLPETAGIRESEWQTATVPPDLQDRRVEITGPVDRKMVINALNSGANAFMADFEDSTSPTWKNLMVGQINLRDAVKRSIEYVHPETGKHYRLKDKPATLLVRPRGWHLPEKHVLVDGEPMAGALFDFGLYLFHNHAALAAHGTGPYFYLPKLENHLEARLWEEVISAAEEALGLAHGTVKVTVLIETIMAAFEMDEILFELRDHIVGLNCGRWDYIFSFIKRFRKDPAFLLPDRGTVTMNRHFLHSYVDLLIRTCHRRGAYAMGGMAAQIPIRDDAGANASAIGRVRADKEREARAGHDGTWVAHPGLVETARAAFDEVMGGACNQLGVAREDVAVSPADLLMVPEGEITEAGVRNNLRIGIRYVEAWLGGQGCVPLYNLMEDAATAEISRSQLWQWLHHAASTDDGQVIDSARLERLQKEELARIAGEVGEERFSSGNFETAARLFTDLVRADEFEEFLTLPAYEYLE